LRTPTMLIAGAALAIWAAVAVRHPTWRPHTQLWPAIVAAIGSLAVTTVFSRFPRVSLEYLGYSVILAALYLLLVRLLSDPFFRPRIVALCQVLFLTLSATFLGLVVLHWVHWWTVLGHLAIPPLRPEFEGLTYGNPSAVMTIVVMLAIPSVALFRLETTRSRAGLVIAVLLVVAVTIASGSRAGWAAIAMAIFLAALSWILNSGRRQRLREAIVAALRTRRSKVGATVAMALAIAGAAVLAPTLVRRATEAGAEVRISYSIIALRMFSESPIVGTGPGTWVIQRIPYTEPQETDYYIPHAHNLESQTLAEQGLVGAAAGLIVLASLVLLFRRAIRVGATDTRKMAALGAVGLLYFGLHQVLDLYANSPSILFIAVIPIAFLDAALSGSTRQIRAPTHRRWASGTWLKVVQVGAILAIAISLVGLLIQEVPAAAEETAVDNANVGLWAAADQVARQAANEDPGIDSYQLTVGLTASRAGDHVTAMKAFQLVADRDDLSEAWLDLAAEQAATAHPSEALTSLGRAMRLGFQRPAVSMPAGDLALRLGNESFAISAFAQAIGRAPSLAADPYWHSDPSRQRIFDRVIDGALVVGGAPNGWQVDLMAGRPENAHALVAAASTSPNPGLVIDAWEGAEDAAATLVGYCQTHPLDIAALLWCARIEGHRGNVARANDYRYLADAIEGGSFASGAELRVNNHVNIGRLQGGPADFWGTWTFRRPTPMDILLPTLVHLTIT
jgi:O-antigen ligase